MSRSERIKHIKGRLRSPSSAYQFLTTGVTSPVWTKTYR